MKELILTFEVQPSVEEQDRRITLARTALHVFNYIEESDYSFIFMKCTLETKDIVETAVIMSGINNHYQTKIVRISGTIKSLKRKLTN